MALDDIFRALEEQADRDIEDILSAARGQADAIAGEAAEEAAEIRRRRLEQAERAARTASAQKLNSVRLESKKRLAGIKEAAVQQAFEDAQAALKVVRGSGEYESLFRSLVDEALDGVGTDAELWVDAADEDLARRTLSALGSPVKVLPKLSTSGGVAAVTGNGRITRRNTLEDRLAKLRGQAQADVAETLFS